MIGREAQRDPWMVRRAERALFDRAPANTAAENDAAARAEVARAHLTYVERQLARGVGLRRLILPMVGLFRGLPRARVWRRHLSEAAARRGAGAEVVLEALALAEDEHTPANIPARAARSQPAAIPAPLQ